MLCGWAPSRPHGDGLVGDLPRPAVAMGQGAPRLGAAQDPGDSAVWPGGHSGASLELVVEGQSGGLCRA